MDPENVGTEAIVRVTHWLRGIWEMRRRGGPVQQWVDSIPSYSSPASSSSSFTQKSNLPESSPPARTIDSEPEVEIKSSTKDNGNSLLKETLLRKSEEMNATAPISIPNSPAITMTLPASSAPHHRLARDPSFQSDSSHCSSVESLLEWRKADPEAILLGLGFGYPSSPQENGSMARIPRRFLQPSKLKGIAVDEFLKQQQESSESLDSASLGYRGLTGSPYVAPSEIVQKIMERLREHESHELDSLPYTNSSNDLFGSMQQDGRLSVLSPDNRQYLERPRSKSPDMRNKRMIIGEKSFAFGYNGDLIEVDSLNKREEGSSNNYEYNSNDSMIELDPEDLEASTPLLKPEENENLKSIKSSAKRLAKQLSFDEDNSSYDSRDTLYNFDKEDNPTLVDQSLSKEQKDCLATVISRCSESVETATNNFQFISGDRIEDKKSDFVSRRASDGIYDLKLNRTSLQPIEERRMSDGGVETKVQRLREGEKRRNLSLDKKPGLRRQARVSEADAMDYGDVRGKEKPSLPLDKIRDISGDKILSEEDIDSDILGRCSSGTFETAESSVEEKYKKIIKDDKKQLCGSDENEECCKNDELDQICEHEETATYCCCHPTSSKCWKKISKKMLEKNEKLEEEVAQLREKLNSVMPVRTEPGF